MKPMALWPKNGGVVVIGAAGSGTAFGFITRLRAVWGDRIHIIGLDINRRELVTASLLVDEFFVSDLSGSDKYKAKLFEILGRYPSATVYPMVNDDFRACSELMYGDGCNGVDFALPSREAIALVFDKALLSEWARRLEIGSPRTYSLDEALAPGAPAALFVKPRDGFGSRGARIVLREEFRNASANQFDECLIQEICTSPEVTVDAFYDGVSERAVAVCRERLEVKAGVCTKARLFLDDQLTEWAARIGHSAGFRGGFCFQVMRCGANWALTDLNFRLGAGTAISASAGADFFAAAHAARIGEDPLRFISLSIIGRGDVFVTRQYHEFLTMAPL